MNPWILLGVAVVGWSAWQIGWGLASRSWPSTQGRVKSVAIRRTQDDGPSRRRVHVKYEYAVDGTAYQGSRLRFGYFGSLFTDNADAVASSYPPDAPVAVHYYPRLPSMSVLEPGFDRANVILSLAVTAAFVAFVYVIFD